MGTARRIVELGRQARTDSGHRIRQPLGRALISVPSSEAAGVALVAGEIADELNIRSVELADATTGIVARHLKPAFRRLGPAFGPDAPAVAAALSVLDPVAVDALLAAGIDGTVTLQVAGSGRTLTADMYEVVERPQTGWALASDGATSIALDTELTPELELEGAARELVRAINDRRKADGLELTDRIVLRLRLEPADLAGSMTEAGLIDLVAREVLAVRVEHGHPVVTEDSTGSVELGHLGTIDFDIERT
jgi:isoleucyl-tRNA synthetase